MDSPIFGRKGSREKASRWFDWHRLMEPMLQWLTMLRFVLLRIGIEQGWAFKTDDLLGGVVRPLANDGRDQMPPLVEEVVAEDAAAARSSVDDAEARAAMQERRKATHNAMHLVARILSSESSMRLIKIIFPTARAGKKAHGEQVVMCPTQKGGLEWWSQVASGKWMHSPLELVVALSSRASLAEMGFPMKFARRMMRICWWSRRWAKASWPSSSSCCPPRSHTCSTGR